MGKPLAVSCALSGFLLLFASIFGSIAPPAFLGTKGLLVCGFLFVVSLIFIGTGFVLYRGAGQKPVVIKLGKEAERDVKALSDIQQSVKKGESAEHRMPPPKKAKLELSPELFASLSKDETNYHKLSKRAPKPEKPQLPKKLPKLITRIKRKKQR